MPENLCFLVQDCIQKALLANEYLAAKIIIQLSIKLPLLGAIKRGGSQYARSCSRYAFSGRTIQKKTAGSLNPRRLFS